MWCLEDWVQWDLESQLDQFVQQGKLKPGAANIGYRPGSYVVFVREWGTLWGSSLESSRNHSREVGSSFSGVNWQRWFYCEDWLSPGGKYKIVPIAKSDDPNGNGACYIDYASDPPSPPPPLPPTYNPNAIVHSASGKCMDVQDGDVSNGKALIASHCGGQQSQGWWFDDNAMVLTHASNNGMCVDVPNGDLSAGNTLQIWDCNGSPQQYFGHDDSASNIFAASSSDASLCVDVQNGGSDDTDALWLWGCNNGDNQRFDVSRAHAAAILA